MGEHQQLDHQLASLPYVTAITQRIKGLAIGFARKELIAIDKTGKRRGLSPEHFQAKLNRPGFAGGYFA
jgi:hypothetical protein